MKQKEKKQHICQFKNCECLLPPDMDICCSKALHKCNHPHNTFTPPQEAWNENIETCSDCGIKWKKIGKQCPVCYAPAEKHSPQEAEWEKEFDKKFMPEQDRVPYYVEYEAAKFFIRSLLQEQKEKFKEVIETLENYKEYTPKEDMFGVGWEAFRKEVLTKIKEE